MLLFHAMAQTLSVKFLGLSEMPIVRRNAMQHTSILVYHRVDNGMRRAAIFCLDVENLSTDLNVRVEPRAHGSSGPSQAMRTRSCGNLKSWEFI